MYARSLKWAAGERGGDWQSEAAIGSGDWVQRQVDTPHTVEKGGPEQASGEIGLRGLPSRWTGFVAALARGRKQGQGGGGGRPSG